MSISAGDGMRARHNAHHAARVMRCGWAMAFVEANGGLRAADGIQKGSSSRTWLVVIASGVAGVSTPSIAR